MCDIYNSYTAMYLDSYFCKVFRMMSWISGVNLVYFAFLQYE